MIGHEPTALYGIDHARTLAIVLPQVMQARREAKREKLLQYAARVWLSPRAATTNASTRPLPARRSFSKVSASRRACRLYELGSDAVEAVVKAPTEHGMVKLGEQRAITPEISRAIRSRLLSAGRWRAASGPPECSPVQCLRKTFHDPTAPASASANLKAGRPLAGRMLADMGAEVTVIARPQQGAVAAQLRRQRRQTLRRGSRPWPLDLKQDAACRGPGPGGAGRRADRRQTPRRHGAPGLGSGRLRQGQPAHRLRPP